MGSLRNFCIVLFCCIILTSWGQERAKDNGDIYVVNVTKLLNNKEDALKFDKNSDLESTTAPNESGGFDAVMSLCNASFSIPMEYILEFNNTGELPDVADKTGMCFIRCFYEKSGFIDNWQLNEERIKENMWPATGDSIEFCQQQGKSESNACIRTYAIARCLMIRAIVDARNKPMV